MERKLEAAKEERIEHLKRSAMRRIANQGLINGWGAWHEMYEDAMHQKRMLKNAASRLTRPALTA